MLRIVTSSTLLESRGSGAVIRSPCPRLRGTRTMEQRGRRTLALTTIFPLNLCRITSGANTLRAAATSSHSPRITAVYSFMPVMRHFTSLPLDDDILQLILCQLPDFKSLQSAICSCKAFYRIFDTYPVQVCGLCGVFFATSFTSVVFTDRICGRYKYCRTCYSSGFEGSSL